MKRIIELICFSVLLVLAACNGDKLKQPEIVEEDSIMADDSVIMEKKKRYEAIRKKVKTSKEKSTDPHWEDQEQYDFNEPTKDEKKP
jgi:hypothetical protein